MFYQDYVIYGLKDPRDGLYHYVGQTLNEKVRSCQHRSERDWSNLEKSTWVKSLSAAGLEFEFCILDRATILDFRLKEREWIVKLRREGHPLTNREYGRAVNATQESWMRLGAMVKQARAILIAIDDEAEKVAKKSDKCRTSVRKSIDDLDNAKSRFEEILTKLGNEDCCSLFYGEGE